MAIIFDEYEYAKKIEKRSYKNHMGIVRDGIILAKYYIDQGKTDKEVYDLLCNKFSILDDLLNGSIKDAKINLIIKCAKSKATLNTRSIIIYKEEMDYIHALNDINTEKTLFVMMCISKYYAHNPIYFESKEINSLSGSHIERHMLSKIINFILDKKYFTLKVRRLTRNIGSSKLCYVICDDLKNIAESENSTIAFEIDDYKNLALYYLEYYGLDKIIRCKECNCVIKKTNNSMVYCKECAKERECLRVKRSREKGLEK